MKTIIYLLKPFLINIQGSVVYNEMPIHRVQRNAYRVDGRGDRDSFPFSNINNIWIRVHKSINHGPVSPVEIREILPENRLLAMIKT